MQLHAEYMCRCVFVHHGKCAASPARLCAQAVARARCCGAPPSRRLGPRQRAPRSSGPFHSAASEAVGSQAIELRQHSRPMQQCATVAAPPAHQAAPACGYRASTVVTPSMQTRAATAGCLLPGFNTTTRDRVRGEAGTSMRGVRLNCCNCAVERALAERAPWGQPGSSTAAAATHALVQWQDAHHASSPCSQLPAAALHDQSVRGNQHQCGIYMSSSVALSRKQGVRQEGNKGHMWACSARCCSAAGALVAAQLARSQSAVECVSAGVYVLS